MENTFLLHRDLKVEDFDGLTFSSWGTSLRGDCLANLMKWIIANCRSVKGKFEEDRRDESYLELLSDLIFPNSIEQ